MRRDGGAGYEEWLRELARASGIETPTREELAKLDRKRSKKGARASPVGAVMAHRNVIPCEFGAHLVSELRKGRLREEDLVFWKRGGKPQLNTGQIKKQFRAFADESNARHDDYGLIAIGDARYKIATSLCKMPDNRTQLYFPVLREALEALPDQSDLTPEDGTRVQRIWKGLGDVLCITVLHHPREGLGVAWREMPRFFGSNWTKNGTNGIDGHILGEGSQGYVRVRKMPSESNHKTWEIGLHLNRGCTHFLGRHLEALADRCHVLDTERAADPRT